MRSVIAFGLVCGLGVGIAGCANPNTRPTHLEFGTSTNDTVVMGPALRMVMERDRQISEYQPPLPTICSEPSPDVAIAFSRTFTGEGKVTEPSGPTAEGTATVNLNETATQLNGRSAGVLALRDGLYAACQSYVNGVIGHDAYSLVLSQYGNLLVALAGTATGGNPAVYSAQDSAIAGMLVACLSEHDPTRIRPYRANGTIAINPLLSELRCKKLLDGIAQGKGVGKPTHVAITTPPKPKPATGVAPAAGEKVTKTQKTITKTVTESTGSPAPAATPAPAAGAPNK